MVFCRILLAMLIALAVATAPVAVALAAAKASVHTADKTATDDCHKKTATHCPDCDRTANKAKCPGDGSKCCKLTGTIAALPEVLALVIRAQKISEPQSVPDRSLRPQLPPPRS